MFKRYLTLVIFLFLFPLFSLKVFSADLNSDQNYQMFLDSYRRYQTNIEPFKTARSQYQAFLSVESQISFFQQAKKLYSTEVESMLFFSQFIRLRLTEATKIINYDENLLFIKLDDEISFLTNLKNNVDKASSLEDLKKLSPEIKTHYKTISDFAYQIKMIIEISSAEKIFSNLKIEKEKINSFLQNNNYPQVKIVAGQNKIILLDKNIDEADVILINVKPLLKKPGSGNSQVLWAEISNFYLKLAVILSGYRNVVLSLQ